MWGMALAKSEHRMREGSRIGGRRSSEQWLAKSVFCGPAVSRVGFEFGRCSYSIRRYATFGLDIILHVHSY
jgi:hypothetical protein